MTPAPTPIILLVEDNADDELLTVRAFKKSNVANQIVVVRDGVEALDWLLGREEHASRDTTVQPQVILLDLKLPRMDGMEVLKNLRQDRRTAHIPVVVLTSSKEKEDVIKSYELGANSYVRKPVEFEKFVEAVKSLGVYWLLLNERAPIRA